MSSILSNLYLDVDFLQGPRENVRERFIQNFVDQLFDLMARTLREFANGRQEKSSSSQTRSVNVSQGPQEQQSGDNPVQQSVSELVRHFEKIQNTFVTVLERRQEDTRVRHDRHVQELSHRQTRHEAKSIEYEGLPPAAKLARHCENVQCGREAEEMRRMDRVLVTALERDQEDCDLHRKKVRLIASNCTK